MINITEKSKCSGCYACMNACPQKCIEMKTESEGFWYPTVNKSKCISCEICENVCPILHKKENIITPVAYAAYSKDEIVRYNSSSGGLFTVFAEKIINAGGVVIGACFDEKFGVEHRGVKNIEGLSKIRGSKYTQSKIGEIYKETKHFLNEGVLVLFTGTPCQVAGLRAYLRKDYDNLYCQDIICHGVPSPKVWKKYVSYREQSTETKIKTISFRDKTFGWKKFSLMAEFFDASKYIQTLDKDLFLKAFLKNVCLRPSCYDCAFKTINRQSDFTLADYWGVGSIMPDMDDDKGTSLLILNSDKARELFEKVKQDIVYKETDLYEAIKHNSAMTESVKENPKRREFFDNIDKYPFDILVKKYCEDSFVVKVKRKKDKIIAIVKSILKKVIRKTCRKDSW